MSSEEEITKLFRVRRTVLQMLKDRGYSVTEIDKSRDAFCERFGKLEVKREDLEIKTYKVDDDSDSICVFFPSELKLGAQSIKNYSKRMKTENVFRAILVYQKHLTTFAKNYIDEIRAKFQLETFEEDELLVNITDYHLVPKHEVLTPDEKKELLERYAVRETQLPRMLVTDPIARYYGVKRGQVFRIIRDSETAGKYVTFRFVV